MFIWAKWRNPIALSVVAVMLAVAAFASFAAASDIDDAADGSVQIGAISKAAADIELAWFHMMGADALAATGEAPAEAQGAYDAGMNLYNSSKAVLAAAGKEPIDQALAGSDQGLVAMNAAFAGTMQLAELQGPAAATANHMDATLLIYNNVEPAVKGLGQIAQAADAELVAKMNNGASDLRLLGWVSAGVVALAAMFTAWSAWSIYRKEDDEAESVASDESVSFERAA